jgi:hypothetical protein
MSSSDSRNREQLWAEWAKAREDAFVAHRKAVDLESRRLDQRLVEINDTYRFLRSPS